MDIRYINPFVKSIQNVFKTMLSAEVEFKKPHVMADEEQRPDVSSIIGFSGDATGSVVLSFSKDVAVKAAATFAGAAMEMHTEDFADAIGELANMVAGGAKAEFEGLNINISLPSVIIGEGHEVSRSGVYPRLVIPCNCKFGAFVVGVSMKIQKPAMAGAAS